MHPRVPWGTSSSHRPLGASCWLEMQKQAPPGAGSRSCFQEPATRHGKSPAGVSPPPHGAARRPRAGTRAGGVTKRSLNALNLSSQAPGVFTSWPQNELNTTCPRRLSQSLPRKPLPGSPSQWVAGVTLDPSLCSPPQSRFLGQSLSLLNLFQDCQLSVALPRPSAHSSIISPDFPQGLWAPSSTLSLHPR